MKRAAALLTVLSIAAVVLTAGTALAGNYKGYGDTGFVHDRKRDCCEDALLLAADDSALGCERAGGTPEFDPRRVRGVCDADWHQDSSGGLRYACRASVTVRCR